MKRWLPFLFALWFPAAAFAQGTFVQGWAGFAGGPIATLSTTVAPANGHNLHIWANWVYTTSPCSSTATGITDNVSGNTYTAVDSTNLTASNVASADFYALKIVNSPTSIKLTTNSANCSSLSMVVTEFSNEGALDGHAAQAQTTPGTATNAVTSGTSVGNAGDTISSATIDVGSNGTISAGTGYALDFADSPIMWEQHLIGTGAGLFTASSASDSFVTSTMAFKPAPYRPLKQSSAFMWPYTGATQTLPPGTTSTSAQVMTGLAGSITPQLTGRISIEAHGDAFSGVIGDGGILQLRYGTGSTPLSLAAATGTAVGQPLSFKAGTTAQRAPFVLNAVVTGLIPGTTYWLDIGQEAVTGSTASIENVTISAVEF